MMAARDGDHAPGSRRTITIVGGGQAGLMLAIGLRQAGHAVRLVQDRSATAIADGRVMSSQCMFATALGEERALGLDLWSAKAPRIEGIRIEALQTPGAAVPGVSFLGRLRTPAISVDQRLKIPAWLGLFEALGGTLEIHTADIDLLERCAKDSELVIVTAGKGPLSGLFPLNSRWSPFTQPMRALSMVYLRGGDAPDGPACITSTGMPAGGVMRFPALTRGGPCEILLFEALIGGALDTGRSDIAADEQWACMLSALARVLPREAERLATAQATDSKAGLAGRITPAVRHAVGRLPSGRRVLGLGDAVVLNDPLVGQGANNAAGMAALALQAILRHGPRPFEETWLDELAAAAWSRVRAATAWTNLSLLPPSLHVVNLLQRATADQAVADRFVQGFDEPATILPLLLGQEAA